MKLKRNPGPKSIKEGIQSKPSACPLPSFQVWLSMCSSMADYSNTNGCQVHPESMPSLCKLFSNEVDVTIYRS